MHISKIQISNYKSFRKSELLEFEPGINIIIGQNNSGKTALLEALELSFEDHPHRDIRNLAASNLIDNESSTIDIVFTFDQEDILKVVEEYNLGTKHADYESVLSYFNKWINQLEVKKLLVENYTSNYNENRKFTISGCPKDIESYDPPSDFPSLSSRKNPMKPFFVNNDNEIEAQKDSVEYNFTQTLEETIFDSFQSRIYRFSAQRSSTGTCPSGTRLDLEPNASNLAEVISQIQLRGKRKIYNKFNEYIHTILPDIKVVSSFDIYDKLSNSTHLLPPALGFIFDSENRSDQQKAEMQKRHPNVKFLPRCNYENYLIHPKAIATILNHRNLDQESITDVDIQDWITEARKKGEFLPKDIKSGSFSEEKWLKKIDGAKLLKNLFSELSKQTIEYRKTEHSVEITNWLIQNEISHLSELSQFIQEAIQEWSENCDQINA